MAQSSAGTPNGSTGPSTAYVLATAVVLAQTKPSNVSIEAYIDSLRANVKRVDATKDVTPTRSRHEIDALHYWQDLCKKHEETISLQAAKIETLKSQYRELELEKSTHRSQLDRRTKQTVKATAKKDFGLQQQPEPLDTESERQRWATVLSAFDDKLQGSKDVTQYLRTLYHLHLQLTEDAQSKQLGLLLVSAADQTRQLIKHHLHIDCFEENNSSPPSADASELVRAPVWDRPHAEQTIILICATFGQLYSAIAHLNPSDAEDEGALGSILPALLGVFAELLSEVCNASSQSPGLHATDVKSTSRGRKRRRESIHTSSAPPKVEDDRDVMAAQTFVRLASMLDPSCTQHASLLEKVTALVLHRVGELLRKTTLERQIITQRERRKARALHHRQPVSGLPVVLHAEAVHLIWMLERLLLMQAHPSIRAHGKDDEQSVTSDSSTQDLEAHIGSELPEARRIQNTLLQAVFPGDTTSFVERLPILPTATVSQVEHVPLPALDFDAWFKQEIWRLVGWNVLADSIAWA